MERFPISIHNSGPMFIRLPNFLSYLGDKEIAKDLIGFLEENPKTSQVGITKDKVTEIRFDYKLDADGMRESWFSDSNKTAAKLRECVLPIIEIFNNTFPFNSPVAFIDSWDSFWITKYEPNPTNQMITLQDDNEEEEEDCADDTHYCLTPADIHYDFNSYEKDIYSIPTMATLTVALNDGDEYEGGEFVIANGFNTEQAGSLEQEFVTLPKSKTGDGLLIDGWTLHGINPITKGARYVFLAHFTGIFKTGTPSLEEEEEEKEE